MTGNQKTPSTLEVDSMDQVTLLEKKRARMNYVFIALCCATVIAATVIPIVLTYPREDCSCDKDMTAHMMSVASAMNRAWGEYDEATYFKYADPSKCS